MTEIIRDGSGRTVGYKVTHGSQTLVQNSSGGTVGRYDANTRQTYDRSGNVRFKGDHTSALIEETERSGA